MAKAVKAAGINSSLLISVVSAVYNAEPWLEAYVREMHAFLAARFKDFEIVIVDNASTDGTVAVIERLQEELSNIQLYCLMRQLNQESAFVVGLEQAIGDAVVTIDANYDPPQAVDDLLERYDQDGVDIVYGVREHGDERPLRGAYYRLAKGFFKVYKAVTKNDLPVLASMFRLLSRRALNSFLDNRERYSLFRVMSAFAGLPYSEVRYQGINRSGTPLETSYAKATYRAGRILLLSSHEPLRLLSLLAVAGALFNVIYSIYVLAVNIFKTNVAEGWTSLSLQSSLMFFLLFLILGVLSEYIGRLFIYSQNRPFYLIAREKRSLVLSRKQDLNITAGDADAPSPSTSTIKSASTIKTSTTSSATPSSTTPSATPPSTTPSSTTPPATPSSTKESSTKESSTTPSATPSSTTPSSTTESSTTPSATPSSTTESSSTENH